MEPTTPQTGWLLKLRKLGRVTQRYAGYRRATINACAKRGWCVLQDQAWRITDEGLKALDSI